MSDNLSMQAVIVQAQQLFAERFGAQGDTHIGWAPGRVNLIGEYTDLNQGYVLPMAIDQGICVVLRLREKPGLSIYAHAFEAEATIRLPGEPANEQVVQASAEPDWSTFVLGVAQLCRRAGCALQGFDAVIHGNLSRAGGVSSSAALTTAISMAIQSATGHWLEPLANAQLCQRVEHDYMGVMCGLMDQMACRMGRSQQALFVDCLTNESTDLPFPMAQAHVLIVNSGVSRTLYSSEYNARREECAQAIAAIQKLGYEIDSLREVGDEMLPSISSALGALGGLDAKLARRTHHVISENARVLQAKEALAAGRLPNFGQLMFASHASLRDDFEVSVPQLDTIVAVAQASPGVLGARLTGAGFGGNAIVLVEPAHSAEVSQRIQAHFLDNFGVSPHTHLVGAANPAKGCHSSAI